MCLNIMIIIFMRIIMMMIIIIRYNVSDPLS